MGKRQPWVYFWRDLFVNPKVMGLSHFEYRVWTCVLAHAIEDGDDARWDNCCLPIARLSGAHRDQVTRALQTCHDVMLLRWDGDNAVIEKASEWRSRSHKGKPEQNVGEKRAPALHNNTVQSTSIQKSKSKSIEPSLVSAIFTY